MTAPWFVRARPRSGVRLRLICFHHAGVGASAYARWAEHMRPDVDIVAVQLPGRESRFGERPPTDLAEVATVVAGEIEKQMEGSFALFGHSMGAVIAYEVSRVLAEAGRAPAHLFVSGRRPPYVRDTEPPIADLSDGEFIREIERRYGGIHPQILAERELLDLLLPTLRADIRALERHPVRVVPQLDCPVTAYGGRDDVCVPFAHVEAWRTTTTGPFRTRQFPGRHFYLTDQRAALVADISESLGHALDQVARGSV